MQKQTIEKILRLTKIEKKEVLFVFTKSDIHQLSLEQVMLLLSYIVKHPQIVVRTKQVITSLAFLAIVYVIITQNKKIFPLNKVGFYNLFKKIRSQRIISLFKKNKGKPNTK